MLNIESRKYFQRAFASSSTVFCPYAIKRENHLQLLRNCSHFNDTNAIIEYLKMTQADRISNDCFPLEHFRRIAKPIIWVPTIEKPNTRGAFLTKTPMDIYNSDEAPVMDAMFSFMKDVTYRMEIAAFFLRNRTDFTFATNSNSFFSGMVLFPSNSEQYHGIIARRHAGIHIAI